MISQTLYKMTNNLYAFNKKDSEHFNFMLIEPNQSYIYFSFITTKGSTNHLIIIIIFYYHFWLVIRT